MAYAGIYPRPALVAEVEGRIVGFILGFVSGWEFGVPDTVGWIDTIGVDPAFQRRGIGKALFKALIDIFRKSGRQKTLETEEQEVEGVNIVYTLASWNDWDLLQFYHSMGLKKGEMLSLEMKMR
jgi:ribosomal protein S18 acetylase RimI-like enzyme